SKTLASSASLLESGRCLLKLLIDIYQPGDAYFLCARRFTAYSKAIVVVTDKKAFAMVTTHIRDHPHNLGSLPHPSNKNYQLPLCQRSVRQVHTRIFTELPTHSETNH